MSTPKKHDSDTPPEELGYGAALAELESIVAGMEQGQVDVDHLTNRITRATALVQYCRDRLNTVQDQVAAMTTDVTDNS